MATQGLKISCSRCGDPIKKKAALVFSPPRGEPEFSYKFHICEDCWPFIGLAVQGVEYKTVIGKQPVPCQNPVL